MTLTILSTLLLQPPVLPAERPADTPPAVEPASPRDHLIELFAEAEKKYRERDYAGALTVFARAYEQSQDPACLANMGRIHEDLGHYEQAAELYRKFLRHPVSSPTDRETIARRLDHLPIVSPPAPRPTVTPPPAPIIASPEPAPRPPPLPQPAPDRRPRRQVIAGGALIALSVPPFVVSGLQFAQIRQIQDKLAASAYDSGEQRDAGIDEGRTDQWIAIATAAAGGALFTTGAVLTAVGGTRARKAARVLRHASLRFAF